MRVAAGILAMAAAVVVYLGGLDNPFVYDDFRVIVENRSIVDLTQVRGLLLQDASRPLANISYAIDYAFWGGGPFGYHLTNLVLHVLNVGLLFLLVLQIAGDGFEAGERKQHRRLLAAFATAITFAVHPLLTQTVGYVSSRPELLATALLLCAFLAARRWITGGGARWLGLTFGCWLLALAAKEVAAVFPLILFWYERSFFDDAPAVRAMRMRRLHLPFVVVAGVAIAARLAVFFFLEQAGAAATFHWSFALLSFDAVRLYLLMAALAHPLSLFHDVTGGGGLSAGRILLDLAVVAALVGTAAWLRVRRRVVALGVAWFLFALLPSTALVLLDRGEVVAEHRVYLASAGLFLAVGAAIARLANYVNRPAARLAVRAAFAAMVVVLAGQTMLRVALWADPVALWSQASLHAPGHWLPYVPLGQALHAAGRHDEAVAALREAVRLRPEDPSAYPQLGVCLTERGDAPEAAAVFQTLLTLRPESTEARNGLATLALLAGRPEVARARYLESLEIDPDNVQARRGLVVLAETVDQDPARALALCREILHLAPNAPGTVECIARNEARLGAGS